jgi:pimeloyl-ACP methyl ester carboxylesterase
MCNEILIIIVFLMGLSSISLGDTESKKVMMSGYAPVNGLRMYYEIHGEKGQAPPLVMLHGGGSTIKTSFEHILPALAKTRQVIAFEQQGHGHTSDVADRPFSFDQSAEDTIALLRYLNIEKADFFGYSNGGHIILQIAMKNPDVVRKMIIESAMFNREGSDPAFWESFKNAKLDDMPEELRNAYLQAAPDPKNLPSFFAKSVQRMLNFKGWRSEEIQSIKIPTLILIGDHDLVRPEHAVLMFHLISNAQLAILPGTDHMSIVNRSDWVIPMIENFLDSPL